MCLNKSMEMKSTFLLLLTAIIWGFSFVTSRVGMDSMGPFAFNGIKFALGSISLIPLILFFGANSSGDQKQKLFSTKRTIPVGIIAGLILFAGASFQQIGLIYTTVGKAAFITCLYIVIVPLLGVFMKHRISLSTWLGCALAIIGLYCLCIKGSFTISYGDLLQLIGALFWSLHLIFIDYYSIKADSLKLACFQFATCSLLSWIIALFVEPIALSGIMSAAIPLLYGGFCGVGIAFTLQIIGQKNSPPSRAAVILSMETVFAAIGGYIVLGERLGGKEIFGCILMLAGMLLTQLQGSKQVNNIAEERV